MAKILQNKARLSGKAPKIIRKCARNSRKKTCANPEKDVRKNSFLTQNVKIIAAECIIRGCSPEFLLGLASESGELLNFKAILLKKCLESMMSDRLPKLTQLILTESGAFPQAIDFIKRIIKSKDIEYFGLTGSDLIVLHGLGISLRWFLFGIGSSSRYSLKFSQDDIKVKPIGKEDREFVRIKYGWDTPDFIWFFGSMSCNKNTELNRVLIRFLGALPVTQILPEMPDLLSLFSRLQKNISSLKLEDCEDEWMKSAVTQLKSSPYKVRLLLLANQAQFSTWKRGDRNPRGGTLKLAFILERQLIKFGDNALIAYLRVLHAEALHQGFSGFDQVVRSGAWKRGKQK